MKAREIMTGNPACCTTEDSLEQAANLMAQHDCGCLPVVDGKSGRVVGVVTDRDIAVRGVARGQSPAAKVSEVMTASPRNCGPDADLADVERTMAERQIRRMVVVGDAGRCVGMIAQADLARAAARRGDVTDREVARVVERISEPAVGASRIPPTDASRQPELEQRF